MRYFREHWSLALDKLLWCGHPKSHMYLRGIRHMIYTFDFIVAYKLVFIGEAYFVLVIFSANRTI